MAYKFKNIIWSLFGDWENKYDSYKVNGKGIGQRFNEMLADDFDQNTLPLITNLSQNTTHPDLMFDSYVGYWETILGIPVVIDDLEVRRRYIKYGARMNTIRGTALSFELAFNLIGIRCTVVEFFNFGGFDNSLGFDSPVRTFDTGENEQFVLPFYLNLSGAPIDSVELARIVNIITKWLSPVGSSISGYSYDSGTETTEFDYDFDFDLG